MTRVFIIGAGKGGKEVLDLLIPLPFVNILGVADRDPAALALKTAQKAGIPIVLSDPLAILKTLYVDVVFDLTGNTEMADALLKQSETRFEVATGKVTHLLIDTLIASIEKTHLLKKHLEISLMITQANTLEKVLDTIVSGSMEITNMPVGSLVLFNQEREEFTLLSEKGLPHELSRRTTYSLRAGGLTQHILANNKPTLISDLTAHTEMDCTALLKEGIRSLIAIPLFSEKELLGILYNDDIKPRIYPSDLIDILGQFATEAVITLQKQKAMTKIRNLSSRDPLTGLYNRKQLVSQLGAVLARADQNNETVALLIADLDRFKEINETLGHQYGDKVIQIMAASIQAALAEEGKAGSALLFRSGVDEISIILPNTTYEKTLHKTALIRKATQEASQKAYFPLDVSIGATLYPEQGQSVDQVITRASRSLLIAKKTDEKVCIGTAMPLTGERLGIKFEPIVDLLHNQVVGYEALSRDTLGRLSVPELFEKYAKLGQLPEVKSACFISQLKKAEEIGLSCIFLNVDSVLLKHCEWVQKPAALDVVLEISEAESLHDLENHLQVAAKWKKKGFLFAIDDFGAGFVSLPFISQLNPDYIKIDRSVILQAVASPKFRLFLSGLVVAMQKDHIHKVVAEGIETETELKITREMGIDLIQGFLLLKMGYLAPKAASHPEPKDLQPG